METNRLQHKLNSEKSKQSVNTDVTLKINMVNNQKLLPTNDILRTVNVADRFNQERQNCKYYRLIGTINPLASNPLFNLDDRSLLDKYTWAGFNNLDFLDGSYPNDGDAKDDGDFTYSKAIDKFLKEKDGWFGFYDPDITKSALCNYFDMEPKRERFSFLPDINPYHSFGVVSPVKNWELTISYPKDTDKKHKLVNNGLLIIETLTTNVSTKDMTAIGSVCRHNLNVGDIVRINGTNGYNGDHEVISLGLSNGDYKDYYYVIDLPNTGTTNNNSRFKKLIDGVESEYYFRKFRKIKTKTTEFIETDDYEIYQVGFSESIFNDKITQYVFNEDIDVTNLTDNLNRPLSEIYLTILKTDSNKLFGKVSSGIEAPYMDKLKTGNLNSYIKEVPVINRIHNGGVLPFETHIPLEANVLINNNNNIPDNNDFYGDLVEYNSTNLNEITLAIITHRFNTISRESSPNLSYVASQPSTIDGDVSYIQTNLGPRQEGYMYQPHHKIKIREFSNYIEEGDDKTDGIPDYAIKTSDGRYLWRDLIDIGFNQSDEKGLDYPFLNGVHYLYNNHCFYLRRQDQFAFWDLYYGKFPADPIGDRIKDNFIVKTANQDVC